MNELTNFIEELPHKLKIETSLYIYEDRYNKVKFFPENQYIFLEGDEVNGIFFLMKG